MDDSSGKKATVGLVLPRKGSGPVLRDTANSRNQIAQYCNRLGCSGRMNSTKGTQFGGLEKPKPLRPSFRSSSGKEIVGGSSRTNSAESSLRKSSREPQRKQTDSSVSASLDHEPEVSGLNPALGKIENGLQPDPKYSEGRESTFNEVGSSSVASSTRKHMNLIKKSGSGKQDSLLGPSVSSVPKNTSQGVRPGTSARYGLRNLKCNSISDVIPSGCSSSDLTHKKKKVAVTKRNSDGESSSFFKGKKRIEPSLESQNSSSSVGVSISDSRRVRNWSSSSDNGNASLGARTSINGNPRMRGSSQGNGTNCSRNESAIIIGQIVETEVPKIVNPPSSSHQNSAEIHSRSPNSYIRPGSSSSGSSHSRFLDSPSEVGMTHALMSQDSFQRYNMNGIAEVLLALERIEQDEELSYEQLLVLETNLFLNGLSFHDHHRDMRLDIDNMSYEELLALEDKMGTVSTALTAEALEKCLKSSIYKSTPPEARAMSVGWDDNNDDVKCSICQEEYLVGDEVGRLQCEHGYHLACIHQWLRLKNWCPICKISAASSPSSS